MFHMIAQSFFGRCVVVHEQLKRRYIKTLKRDAEKKADLGTQ